MFAGTALHPEESMRAFSRDPIVFFALAVLSTPAAVAAQDPFEIQVYEYELVPIGIWNLETHINHTARASLGYNKGQSHVTFELTRGISQHFELAGYLLTSYRAGREDIVGWHIRPRFALPEDWFPVKVSLSTEIGFPTNKNYEDADVTLELRPIFEKTFGKVQVDVNPVFGRAWGGAEGGAWDFEPDARVGYPVTPVVDLSLEYYAAMNGIKDPNKVHQIFPNADIQLRDNLVWNIGVGFGTTNVGNQLVYKMRLGWMFGGPVGAGPAGLRARAGSGVPIRALR